MKNELQVFFIRKPDYAYFSFVTISLELLVATNLCHLDVVSANTGLTPCGLKTKATRWSLRESTKCRSDEIFN